MNKDSKVFFALPTHDNCNTQLQTLGLCGGMPGIKASIRGGSTSLLAHNFNQMWCAATAKACDCDYFCMIHSDIAPIGQEWLIDLISLLEHHNADIMSATMPIKSDAVKEYSTTLMVDRNVPTAYRLTHEHFKQLPTTFNGHDLRKVSGHDGELCVNTGLWACRLQEEWNHEVSFNVRSWIDRNNPDKPVARVISEDWDFAMQCHALGLKVMGTKAIKAVHCGGKYWPNWIEGDATNDSA